jgi:TonB family protein
MTVLEVDTAAARYDESAAPPYPPSLLARRIEGSVAVQYIVDTTGRADTTSFVVLTSSHDEFSQAVKRTLPDMRFRSAVMGSRKVRQLVQQLFTFKIDTTLIAKQEAEKKRKP